MKRSPTTWLGPGLMATMLALLPGTARAGLILETASLGPSTPTEGYAINATSFLGARFHVASAVAVDHIGGHFVFQPGGLGAIPQGQGGSLFGAIIQLSGPTALPADAPFAFTPLASALFSAPTPSAQVLVPLAVNLQPGDYAVVFGSGRFGATGLGGTPADDTPIGQPSYFFGDGTTWHDGGFGNVRFVVSATPLDTNQQPPPPPPPPSDAPEPGSLTLLGLGVAGLGTWAWRRR
jgi:PEP-CTERM motif